MMRKEQVASIIAGAGVGTATIFLLREHMDEKGSPAAGLPIPEGFKTYSALVGIIGGTAATVVGGLYPALTGKSFFDENINTFLTAAGITLLTGGILSALYPKTGASAGLTLTPVGSAVTIVPAAEGEAKEVVYA